MANIYINRESVLRVKAKDNQEFFATKMEVSDELKEKINAVQNRAAGLSKVLEHCAVLIQSRHEEQAEEELNKFFEEEKPPAKPARKRAKKESSE